MSIKKKKLHLVTDLENIFNTMFHLAQPRECKGKINIYVSGDNAHVYQTRLKPAVPGGVIAVILYGIPVKSSDLIKTTLTLANLVQCDV